MNMIGSIRRISTPLNLNRISQWRGTSSLHADKAFFSTKTTDGKMSEDGNVGIVMLNMGGPSSLDGPDDGVELFLRNLFLDKDIIPLGPLQKYLVCL